VSSLGSATDRLSPSRKTVGLLNVSRHRKEIGALLDRNIAAAGNCGVLFNASRC
jgi:hypothetical protein